jgi:hypothetical protein
MNVFEQINEMIHGGKKYLYRDKVIQIKGFEERSGMFCFKCLLNGKETNIDKDDFSKAEIFINTLVPFEDINTNVPKIIDPEPDLPAKSTSDRRVEELFRKNEEAFRSVGNMLMEDIKRVREQPSYVAQAKQVANSAQAIVNLVKLQLQIASKG